MTLTTARRYRLWGTNAYPRPLLSRHGRRRCGLALGYFVVACLGAVALAQVPQERPGTRYVVLMGRRSGRAGYLDRFLCSWGLLRGPLAWRMKRAKHRYAAAVSIRCT